MVSNTAGFALCSFVPQINPLKCKHSSLPNKSIISLNCLVKAEDKYFRIKISASVMDKCLNRLEAGTNIDNIKEGLTTNVKKKHTVV